MPPWIEKLSSPEVIRFIQENAGLDEQELLLKHDTLLGLPTRLLARQLKGRRKAKEKLPLWYQTPGIVYPPAVALEQCSSEITARYKTGLIMPFVGQNPAQAADLTGGMGVDTFYLSTLFQEVAYVEPDASLLEISRHNHQVLGAKNIHYHALTAHDFLKQNLGKFDLVYADPSRKSSRGSKAIRLQDCSPDITALQNLIFASSPNFLLKTSPLLDISEGLRQLPQTTEVHVVAVNNEVKELLFLATPFLSQQPVIKTVNFQNGNRMEFAFTFAEEQQAEVQYAAPLTWLYEPNLAIMKAGAFKLAAGRFGLLKLHPNTHLYTSHSPIENFPGRMFRVEAGLKPGHALKNLYGARAHVLVRNYPVAANRLALKYHLTAAGEDYLIACTSVSGKHLLLTKRIK
ncbi:MAG: hypothetical protein KatS3mg032_1422 [Cyclobacteriaceae bacterium]|nr:MAG: hypothetical protein KatS3mg032_1422 [Cyclobacteriaceae bacterium]